MSIASFRKYGSAHHHRTSQQTLLQLEATVNQPASMGTLMLYHRLMVSALPKNLAKRGATVRTLLALNLRKAGFTKENALALCKAQFNVNGNGVYATEVDEHGVIKAAWIDCGASVEACSFEYNESHEEPKAEE